MSEDRRHDGAGTPRVVVVGQGPRAVALARALAPGSPRDALRVSVADDAPALLADASLASPDLVVEAAPDAPRTDKSDALLKLLRGLPAGVAVAVATRLHTVEDLDPARRGGSRLVGLHLVTPREQRGSARSTVAEMALPGAFNDDVVDAVLSMLGSAGLVALPCGDAPGRIVDRLVASAALESRSLVQDGLATPEAIGRALADGGLDLGAVDEAELELVAGAIHAGLGEPDRFRFVARAAGGPPTSERTPLATGAIAERLELAVIAEAYRLVGEAVAGADEIERAMTHGAGWSAGPFTLAGRHGLRAVVTALVALCRTPGVDPATADRFAVPSLLWQIATV